MIKEMKSISMLFLVVFAFLIAVTAAYSAEYANPQLLLSPADVEKNIGKWVIVDCREKDLYDKGHIPSAIHLGETCNNFFREDLDIKGIGIVKNLKMRPLAEIEKRISSVGLSLDKTIVFYDSIEGDPAKGRFHGTFAGYVFVPFWYFEYLGHKDVRVLNGGIEAWTAAGKALDMKENKLPPSKFKAKVVKNRLTTTDEMLKIAKGEIKDVQVIDSRLPAENSGELPAPPGHFLADKVKRKGHIPNTTVNIPHFLLLTDKQTAKIKSMDELEKLHAKLDKNKRTTAYCYIANRISLEYFVLRLMGFKDPAIYHDSFIVWGNDEKLPVETGPTK